MIASVSQQSPTANIRPPSMGSSRSGPVAICVVGRTRILRFEGLMEEGKEGRRCCERGIWPVQVSCG